MTLQFWPRKAVETVNETQGEPVDPRKFPLARKVDLLVYELQQAIRDIEYLHRCTGNEYAERRKQELQLRLEEIKEL